MSLKDFVFELEDLEMKAKILTCTFGMCIDELGNRAGEDAGMVMSGLYNYTYDLTNGINKLVDKGFETIRKQE